MMAMQLFGPLTARWRAESPQRQRIWLALAAISAAVLLWAYVWHPSTRARADLSARIPALESQLVTMRTAAEEVKRLNAMPAMTRVASTRIPADQASLQALFGVGAVITQPKPGQFQIRHVAIDYPTWLDKLDQALNKYALSIGELRLRALAQAGQVEASLELRTTGDKK